MKKNKEKENNKEEKNEKSSEHAKLEKDFEELKDTLQRNHAEFQNYRRRSEEEKSRFIKLSNGELIKNILPIIDNFELALKHNKEDNEFSKGMGLIYDQLINILHDEGLQKIPINGKFNPNLHEVVMVEESDKDSGLILQELQKGYSLSDKVIRSSKVKISKQKSNNVEVDKNE